ncbi:MAG: hypothetical protein LKI98_05460 [Bifidobacterium crudilactis]|nr:hypothetical protein [Bifidobacterium crudilactis]MCI1889869.1 hypothetical protein [Bifidobacterium crudilactis]
MGFRVEKRRRLLWLKRYKRLLRLGALTVGGLLLTVGVSGAIAAGGAGSGSGPAGGGDQATIEWRYQEDFGAPTNANVKAVMMSSFPGIYIGPNGSGSEPDGPINAALTQAINEAHARGASDPLRLTGVGFIHSTGTNSFTGSSGGYHSDQWRAPWASAGIQGVTYSHDGADYHLNDYFDGGTTSVNSLVIRETVAPESTAVIVIVLGDNEPPSNYNLSLSTQAQFTPNAVNAVNAPTLLEGSSGWVRDHVILNRNGSSLSESVNIQAWLNYNANYGWGSPTKAQQQSQTLSGNSGSYDLNWFTYSTFGMPSGWQKGDYWWDIVASGAHMNGSPRTFGGAGVASERWRVVDRQNAALELSSQAGQALVTGWDQSDLNASKTVTQTPENTVMAGSNVTLTDQVRVSLKDGAENQNLDTNSDGRMDSFHYAVETRLTINGQTRVKSLNYRGYYRGGTQCAALGAPEIDGDVDVNGCATFGFTPSDFGWSVWPGGSFKFQSHLSAVGSKDEGRNAGDVYDLDGACGNDYWGVRSNYGAAYAICLAKGDWTSERAASENGWSHHQLRLALDTAVTPKSRNDGLLTGDAVTLRLVDDEDNTTYNRVKATMSGIENLTIPVRGSYWWSPTAGSDGDTVASNAKKVCDAQPRNITVGAAGDWKPDQGSYSFNVTRANVGGSCANVDDVKLGTGYYTWVWQVAHTDVTSANTGGVQFTNTHFDKQFTFTVEADKLFDWTAQVTGANPGTGPSLTDGWQPGTEQTLMRTPWTLALNKHGRIGKEDGSWSPMPAEHASFTLTEIEQSTATSGNASLIHSASMKAGGQAVNASTDDQGQLTITGLRDLEPGETRYYRLVETGVDHPMTVPGWDPVLGEVVREAGWVVTVGNTNGSRGVSRLSFDGYEGNTQAGSSTPWNETDHLIDKRRQTGATLALVAGTGIPSNLDADTATALGVSKGSGVQNRPTAVLQDLGDTQLANTMLPVTGGVSVWKMTLLTVVFTALLGSLLVFGFRRLGSVRRR